MIEKKHENERLLEIDNRHFASCGPPPTLDARNKYVGYFENPYGEQWVFIGDPETGEAVIRGGDIGWAAEHKVSLKDPCPKIILNDAERMWIITCFMGMSHKSFDEVVTNYNRAAMRRVEALRRELEDDAH
jgi:hypothetical protein